MTATIRVRPLPGTDTREVVIDCKHATTTATIVQPPGVAVHLSDVEVARVALARHYGEEACRCTRRLRQRYGLEGD
jgi:hypothetical protein